MIVLNGVSDPDFNHDPQEGSGTDVVYYHIPTSGFTGAVTVTAEVYYQSLPPNWMDEIFTFNTPEINTWQDMYAAADRSPVLMRTDAADVPSFVSVDESKAGSFLALGRGREILLRVPSPGLVSIYDTRGKLVHREQVTPGSRLIPLPAAWGTYLVEFGGTVRKVLLSR